MNQPFPSMPLDVPCPCIVCQSNRKPDPRPSKEDYYFAMAKTASTRSSCNRGSFGAIIVSPDGYILSTGYNGSPPGEPHCFDVGCQVEDNHCQRALHAEVNAVAHAAKHGVSLDGASMYVYGGREPCCECTKVLKAVGIFNETHWR